jgi:hypothetical protein
MGATNTNPFLDAFRKAQAGELSEEDFIKMMEPLGKSPAERMDEVEEAGLSDPRTARKRRENAARIKRDKETYGYNERGQRVRLDVLEREQSFKEQWEAQKTMPKEKPVSAEERRERGKNAVEAELNRRQGREDMLSPSSTFAGPLSKTDQAIRDTRAKAASNEEARVQGEREARPFAAVVEGMTNPRGEAGKVTRESFEQISKGHNSEEFQKSGSIEQGATRDGKSFKMVTRKTPYGDITTKVFDSAEDADSVTGMVPSSDGKTAQPISEVTAALAQQNAADAAPSIAETYANASRQQNRGVGGDRNPSTDIIAGLTATADPNIIANPAVNEKSKEDLEREKRIKAMTQGLFPSNTRRATAV